MRGLKLKLVVLFAGLFCVGVSVVESIISDVGRMGQSGRSGGDGGGVGGGDGQQGPLLHNRAKRYANSGSYGYGGGPRGSLAYLNKVNANNAAAARLGSILSEDEGNVNEPETLGQLPISVAIPNGGYYTKRYLLGRESEVPVSHFREFAPPHAPVHRQRQQQQQQPQQPQVSSEAEFDGDSSLLTSYPILARRSTRRFGSGHGNSATEGGPSSAADELTGQLAPLTDEELQTILLLLDGYALSSKGGAVLPRNPHSRASSSKNTNNNINEVIAEQLLQQQQAQAQAQSQSPNFNYPTYNPNYLSPEDLRRVARMYAMGKRENEPQQYLSKSQQQQIQQQQQQQQGRFFDLQQEHSPGFFEEPEPSERLGLEFLTPKRSKRVGGGIPVTNPELAQMSNNNNNRIKKETAKQKQMQQQQEEDQENEEVVDNNSSLDDDNGETEPPRALPLAAAAPISVSVTTDKAVLTSTTSGSSSSAGHNANQQQQHPTHAATGQIPAPSQSQQTNNMKNMKNKKSIDWSQYFGIDKKSGSPTGAGPRHQQNPSEAGAGSSKVDKMAAAAKDSKDASSSSAAAAAVVSGSGATATAGTGAGEGEPTTSAATAGGKPPKSKAIVAARITEPNKTVLKESKDHKKLRMREENETENKSDRKWILNEFYKNMAMSTNVKRKRDVSGDETEQLAQLEEKMKVAGDDIIWDALKYTGAHKDEPLSPLELAQVKKEIIGKLATAYNLEKIREAIDSFREQLIAIKTNNV